MNGQAGCLGRPLDNDPANGSRVELFKYIVPDLQITDQVLGVRLAVRIPDRIVVLDDAEANTGWMYLLTHTSVPLTLVVRDLDRDVAGALQNSIAPTLGACTHALHGQAFIYKYG